MILAAEDPRDLHAYLRLAGAEQTCAAIVVRFRCLSTGGA